MLPRIIKSEAENEAALRELERLWDAPQDSPEAQAAELWTLLIENFEKEHYPILPPDAVSAILFLMDQQGLAPKDLVPHIGSKGKVSEVLNRKRPLSLAMIRKLHQGLGIPLDVLIQDAKEPPRAAFEGTDWREFPLAEIVRRGWFADIVQTRRELFERAEEILGPYLTAPGIPDFQAARLRQRVRSGSQMNEKALWAWQARVWHLAEKQKIGPFRAKAVNPAFIGEIARLSAVESGPRIAREMLAKVGIKLVVEPALPGTHLDGVAIRCDDGAVIVALTLRHDRLDNFWFTLAHELAHVIRHLPAGDCRIIIDDLEKTEGRSAEEREADRLAMEAMIPERHWAAFRKRAPKSRADLLAFADQERVHPAIVAGRWRRETRNYRIFGELLGRGKVRSSFA